MGLTITGAPPTPAQGMGMKEVVLCKKILAIWAKLGMDYKKIKCNCVW